MGLGTSTLLAPVWPGSPNSSSDIQQNFKKEIPIECTCTSYIDEQLPCSATDHNCSCCTIIWDDMVFSKFVLACQSRDLHTCICQRQVAGTIIEPGVLYCRSITGHECVCGKMQPSECQAYRHPWCVCMQLSPEKCRADSTQHYCSCWISGRDRCRVQGRGHQCTCTISPAECKSRYGYHTCVCGGTEGGERGGASAEKSNGIEGEVSVEKPSDTMVSSSCRARIHAKDEEVPTH